MGTDEERRRFDLLRQAYVGARYDQGYKITAEELKYLASLPCGMYRTAQRADRDEL